ncbi:MAG: type II toxin-antitoxin system HicA family toxin [Segetibacter sp.]|nr:type II toxin-antitoxin system HicA family toxin [Segetibacter sp.]
MSQKLPVVNSKQLIKALEYKGFFFSRQTGSHAIYINNEGIRVTIPIHGKKDIGKGLLKQILSDARLLVDELKALI